MSRSRVYIEIGKVGKAHGLRGELKVLPYTANVEDLARYDQFWVAARGKEMAQFAVESMRPANGAVLLKLEGIESRTDADNYCNAELFIQESQLPAPAEGQYYIRDLIGLRVLDESGADWGVLEDVLELPSNDVYQIRRDGKEILLPAIAGVVLKIQLDQRIMTVHLPAGLAAEDS